MSVTKIILPLLVLLSVSCTKYERRQRPNPHPTGYSIEIAKNDKLSTGQIVEQRAPVAVIHVWKADNKNYEIVAVSDAIGGYATDKSSDRLESAYYSALSAPVSAKAKEGKYFVFVMLNESPAAGKFSYSYTSFEVKKGEETVVKKTFTSRAKDSQFEDWDAYE